MKHFRTVNKFLGLLVLLIVPFCLGSCQKERLSNYPHFILKAVETNTSYELNAKLDKDGFYDVIIYSFDNQDFAKVKFGFIDPPYSEKVNEYVKKNNYKLPIITRTTIINKTSHKIELVSTKNNPTADAAGTGKITVLAEKYLQSGDYLIKIDIIKGNHELNQFYNKVVIFARSAK